MHPTNFRDVGEALGLWLDAPPVSTRRLFRGGSFDALTQLEDLGSPRTILNLRRGPDPAHLLATLVHVPAPDDLENYHTQTRRVSDWVRAALQVLAAPETEWPVYVHCTSGRDRTGVVVAAALVLAGVPREVIVEEYALSSGGNVAHIERALDGLGPHLLESPAAARLRRHLLPP
ncbi:MAG: tyrosine-protein phosphatase [Polyangiaceae bacterium]